MKTSILAFAIGTVLVRAAEAAPAELSLTALDVAVAGSERVETNESESSLPSGVVADQSQLAGFIRRSVELNDDAQRDARAMNLTNVGSADVASGFNAAYGVGAGQVIQSNSIWQFQGGIARAASLERRGSNRHSESSRVSEAHSGSNSYVSDEHRLFTRSNRSVVDTYNAQVPGYFPLQNLKFEFETPKLPSVTVPRFGFNLTTTDDAGGIYGIRGALGPFHFDPPQLSLGSIALSGNDLVIRGGYVQLPSLDLGSATVDLCVVKCAGVAVDLPTINGPKIDFGAEYRLEGANPFKDVRVNAGGGFAGAGQGSLSVSLGSVRVAAEVSLDLPDVTTSFKFDVLGHEVDTGEFGVEIPAINASIELIDADVGVAYSATFDGALCLSIVTTNCDGLEHREQTENSRVDVTKHTERATRSASGSTSKTFDSTDTAGATMTGAEANLIAMSEGSASVDLESVVGMNAQAQKGLNVLNAVNATGAMIGNAANVSTQRSMSSATAVSQNNTFTQFQTRPRGR